MGTLNGAEEEDSDFVDLATESDSLSLFHGTVAGAKDSVNITHYCYFKTHDNVCSPF